MTLTVIGCFHFLFVVKVSQIGFGGFVKAL